MAKDALETMRQMLHISSSAQLLFDHETLVAASPGAVRLIPDAIEGTAAEHIFGPAVEEYRHYNGKGTLLFTMDRDGVQCDFTVAACEGYFLVSMVVPWESLGLSTMISIAESVRRPMSAIFSITPKILPLLEETSDTKAMLRAAELNRSLYEILRITGNLQMYGVLHGSPAMRIQRVDLWEWLDNLVERVKPLCEHADRNLSFLTPMDSFGCAIDPDRMERVILNIISNSMKFTDKGGTITVALKKQGGRIWITIRDNGCGIAADQMGVIFCRSENRGQIPDPRWGVGLGLPIARSIIRAHGGCMLMESEEGKGTTVLIALDARKAPDEGILRSPVKIPDYSGGIDHTLIELSDVLPSDVFDTRGVDL